MTSTVLALLLGCSLAPPQTTDVSSPNGRFTLHVTPDTLSLSERGAAAPRWSAPHRPMMSRFFVSDDGAWVVGLNTTAGLPDAAWAAKYGAAWRPSGSSSDSASWVTRFDAKGAASSPPLTQALDDEEVQHLPVSTCGVEWVLRASAQGDVLSFLVDQQGVPWAGEPGFTSLALDARRGTVTRGPHRPWPSIAELIRAHAQEGRTGRAFEALQLKARLPGSRGEPALCGFFAGFTQDTDGPRRRDAIDALGDARCERELASLVPVPRGDDGDLATFDALIARDPATADQFALEALRRRRPPVVLRQRAAHRLVSGPSEAARLALDDPDPQVRLEAVLGLRKAQGSPEAFTLLLEAAGRDADEAVAARGAVLAYFERGRGTEWLAPLANAVHGGRLAHWPAALVVLGGAEDAPGRALAAAALYQRAVEALDAQLPKPPGWPDGELWCEAKLRLAHQAAEAGSAELSLKLANEVLAWGGDPFVGAPGLNRYAGGTPVRSARTVAGELVASRGAPPPKPLPQVVVNPQALIQHVRDVQKQIREQREAAEARRRASMPAAP